MAACERFAARPKWLLASKPSGLNLARRQFRQRTCAGDKGFYNFVDFLAGGRFRLAGWVDVAAVGVAGVVGDVDAGCWARGNIYCFNFGHYFSFLCWEHFLLRQSEHIFLNLPSLLGVSTLKMLR